LFAHRISYLPLLLPKLHAFFHDSLIDSSIHPSQGWFSFEDVPLKWHHPIGLLFDLYSGSKEALAAPDLDSPGGSASGTAEEKDLLPWKLTLSFSNWPADTLITMDPEFAALKDAFQNSVKEAAFVRHNTSKVIMAMGKEDTTQLWESVEKGK
jgi:autophagy-related protein 5